jgi:diketogulonate reductase-like aldo/keto reductase
VGVILKTSSINRLIENYESWTVELTVDDMKKMKGIKKDVRVCMEEAFSSPLLSLIDAIYGRC